MSRFDETRMTREEAEQLVISYGLRQAQGAGHERGERSESVCSAEIEPRSG